MPGPKKNDPAEVALRQAIGHRIEEAWRLSGFGSRAAFIRATGLKDHNALHRYALGKTLPKLRPMIVMADTLGVTLDWLATGAETGLPESYFVWCEASEMEPTKEERRFARGVPLRGYRASFEFWDAVLTVKRSERVSSAAAAGEIARHKIELLRHRVEAA